MTRIVWPLPPNRAVNRVDAGFLDPEYPKWRQRMGLPPDEHPGIDINLTGTSGNADEGYPVVSIMAGTVVHVGRHRVWGNIVLIKHPKHLLGGFGYSELYSQYAHLKFVCVRKGDYVVAGEPVGAIGRGDPTRPFMAHLHFELRTKDLPPDYWPRTRDAIRSAYIDPEAFLNAHASYERRFTYPKVIIYEGGVKYVRGQGVVNLDNPDTLHLRLT